MRYKRLSILLILLLVAFPSPGAAAEPPPAEQQPPRSWRDPFPYVEDVVQAAIRNVQRVQQLEAIEMVSAIAGGSQMGPGEGWFHAGQSRYDWKWLAAQHGITADGTITRKKFTGTAELFDRLDRNRDGVLTAEDFDKLIKPEEMTHPLG